MDETERTKRNVLASVEADSVPRQQQLGGESGDISKEGGRIIPSNANIQRSPRGLFLIIVYYRDDVTDRLRFALAVLFPRGFKADRAKRVNFAASACLDATKNSRPTSRPVISAF